MGRKGEAITLVTPREIRLLRVIEKDIRKKLKPLRLPTQEDVAARRREAFVASLREALRGGAAEPYGLVAEELAEEFSPMEIAAGAIQLAFEAAKGAPLTAIAAADGQAAEDGMTRLVLDAGRRAGVRPGDIVKSLTADAAIPGSAIGNIDVQEDVALIDVKNTVAARILKGTPVLMLRGGAANLTLARPKTPKASR